jgi:hypothetical protein
LSINLLNDVLDHDYFSAFSKIVDQDGCLWKRRIWRILYSSKNSSQFWFILYRWIQHMETHLTNFKHCVHSLVEFYHEKGKDLIILFK